MYTYFRWRKEGGGSFKSVKKFVYLVRLKFALLLVKNVCFGVKKVMSELGPGWLQNTLLTGPS